MQAGQAATTVSKLWPWGSSSMGLSQERRQGLHRTASERHTSLFSTLEQLHGKAGQAAFHACGRLGTGLG